MPFLILRIINKTKSISIIFKDPHDWQDELFEIDNIPVTSDEFVTHC